MFWLRNKKNIFLLRTLNKSRFVCVGGCGWVGGATTFIMFLVETLSIINMFSWSNVDIQLILSYRRA